MVSPDFARATGMNLTKLEQPISLQLACVGSKSTINYGTKATIVFSNTHVKEYLDVANIDYYDVILGTLFLRRLGIALDFAGPGTIRMGASVVPKNLPPSPNDEKVPRHSARTKQPLKLLE